MTHFNKRVAAALVSFVTALEMVAISLPLQVVAASNESTIYNFLKGEMGLNTAAACGVLANIEKESGFSPNLYGDNNTSYGICQWHAERMTNLINWCGNHGYDYKSLEGQLYFLKNELETNVKPGVYSYIKNVDNTAEGAYNAGYKWCYSFEVPAGYNTGVSDYRGYYAQNVYWAKYGDEEVPNFIEIRYNANGGTIESDKYYERSDGGICRKSDDELMGGEGWPEGYTDPYGLVDWDTVGLTREGYEFVGWCRNADGSGDVWAMDDPTVSANDIYPEITKQSGEVMLYAVWRLNKVAMCYNANGGTISDDSEFYLGDNDMILRKSDNAPNHNNWDIDTTSEHGLYNASSFKLSRPGYQFLGWSLSKNGAGEGERVFDEDDGSVVATDFFPDIRTQSGTVTFYAQWSGKEMAEEDAAGKTIPDGNYWIVNGLSRGYLVDILGDTYTTEDGTNLLMHQWDTHDYGKYDVFTVKYLDNGFYSITQNTTQMAMSTDKGKLLNNTNVSLNTYKGDTNQQWSIKCTNGGYILQSRESGLCLDVKGGSVENANLQVYEGNSTESQFFSFIPYDAGEPIKDGSVYRIGTINGKGAYINGAGKPNEYVDGQNVQIWDAWGDNYFKFKYCGDGFYKIIDNQTGYALDVFTGGVDNKLTRDRNVQFYSESDSVEQYWAILPAPEEGYYFIISKLNGHYLDLDDGKTENGTNIHVWSASGNTQKWTFVENKKFTVTPPTKTQYAIGEKLDTKGMTVKLLMSDGYEQDVTNDVKITYDFSKAGKKKVTVTFENGGIKNTASFEVTVTGIQGDVNSDGEFNVLDIVLVQKWLLATPETHLSDWNAADLDNSGQIDVFDLSLMKRKLLKAK